jgi:hypothetical protein
MAKEKQFAPRLHVLMASKAPYGVIIRRGPSKQVCTIGWNREDDSFQVGQWLKGRIYERRSDLSPDGKHMIYFAMNGRWQSESKGSWTALSKAPYLKALGFWTKGDCWHGGGLFVKNGVYWINDGYGHEVVSTPPSLKRIAEYPNYEYYGGECFGVYFLRLMRDDWEFQSQEEIANWHNLFIFEKRLHDKWIFRKFVHGHVGAPAGKSVYYDTHEIENKKTGEKIEGDAWEWAEVDGKRLVWAEAGQIFAARLGAKGLGETKMLQDFNNMTFENLTAPY